MQRQPQQGRFALPQAQEGFLVGERGRKRIGIDPVEIQTECRGDTLRDREFACAIPAEKLHERDRAAAGIELQVIRDGRDDPALRRRQRLIS